jgi:hypothetical protein
MILPDVSTKSHSSFILSNCALELCIEVVGLRTQTYLEPTPSVVI